MAIYDYRQDPSKVLGKRLKNKFETQGGGRYLKRSFLLALTDEIGHDADVTENIPIVPGDDNDSDSDYMGDINIAFIIATSRGGRGGPRKQRKKGEYPDDDTDSQYHESHTIWGCNARRQRPSV
ncbi:uncharacterized protein F4822DRAFT_153246 [Hypoxylon trugodes]|uniref:uncharacterized protein n=1 Tax=Hypoxylon trugodes TaxID=326681 RepID=UPI00218FEA83|nr:uncharacterized protein F4822DRAFT_153246 [Hypoxylon trugodes]KAI1390530.1 hypothetical protein F4822DRAFT_153246 [Hypoxylon trugodes]